MLSDDVIPLFLVFWDLPTFIIVPTCLSFILRYQWYLLCNISQSFSTFPVARVFDNTSVP